MILRRAFNSKGWLLCLLLLGLPVTGHAREPVILPLMLNSEEVGRVALYDSDVGRYVLAGNAAPLVTGLLKPAYRAVVGHEILGRDVWLLDEVRGGVSMAYNAENVLLELRLPEEMLQPHDMTMQPHTAVPPGRVVAPAGISGFANLYAAETHQDNMGLMSGRQPVRVDVDAAVNVKGWVAETQATYTEEMKDGAGGFEMQGRRLVHDDTDRMLRYQMGELSYPVAGLQRYRELVGAGVAKRFDLQPYRVTRPSGRAEFVLESASTVEVYVNGNRLQTLQLAAGTYKLSDFPVVNGANDLKLVITDAAGRRVTQTFPVVSDGDMLGAGLMSYALSGGVPAKNATDNGAAVSGLLRYGVNDQLTAGANFQGDVNQQVMGGEASWAGLWGMLHADTALSLDANRDDVLAGALRIDYRNVVGQRGRDSWQAGLEYRGEMFNLPEGADGNPYAVAANASYTKSLSSRLSMTVGSQYRFGRDGTDDDVLVSQNILWRFDRAWTLTLDTTLARETGFGVLAGVTWSPDAGTTLGSNYDSLQRSWRNEWLRRPLNSQLGLDTDVALERRTGEEDTDYALAGTATYTGERGLVRVRQEAATNGLDSRNRRARAQTTQLSVASALVFADGTWGVSRPVANSFAIVDSNEAVGLNPQVDVTFEENDDDAGDSRDQVQRFEASSGILGAAVLPDLSPYLYRSVNVDVMPKAGGMQDAAHTLAAGDLHEQMVLLPAYKSGTRLHIAIKPRTRVFGVLVDAAENPLGLLAAEVRMVDVPPAAIEPAAGENEPYRNMVFTNRKGEFEVYGLYAGRYELVMGGVRQWTLPFTVPEPAAGDINLGRMQVDMLPDRERSMLSSPDGVVP